MNTRSRWLNGLAAVALLTGCAASAEETAPLAADSLQTPQQEIGAELSAGIRDSLNGVTPEITLPAIDVHPPAPVAVGG
jgi:uncharacterized lipoprotein YbaY